MKILGREMFMGATPVGRPSARDEGSFAPAFDIPNSPWSVKIDGKTLIIRDACNEYVGEFKVESKCLVSDVAKLIEQATRAR